jgi:hypothetical protein
LTGFRRAFPERRSLERWQAIYREAPDGARIMLAWSASGEIAAHYAGTVHRGRMGGMSRLVCHVRDVFSVPKHRPLGAGRVGVFVRTGRAFLDRWGHDFLLLYGFPSPRSFRLAQVLMGATPFSRCQAWGLPLRGTEAGRWPTTGIVREAAVFDQTFDDLWAGRAARLKLAVIRDSRFLDWRFGREPERPYSVWTFASYLMPGILGYLVFRRQGDRALLVDLCLPEEPPLYHSFWAQVGQKLYGRGIRRVETWSSPNAPDLPALWALGFRELAIPAGIVPCFTTFQADVSRGYIDENFYYNMADSDLY